MQRFTKFVKRNFDQMMAEYKEAEDKAAWARDMGVKVVQFHNTLENEGYGVNTSRTMVTSVRALFRDNARLSIVRRGAIPRARVASNEHKFTQAELQKMYYYADTFDKGLLSLGVSIGFSNSDLLNLKSLIENLVNYAI